MDRQAELERKYNIITLEYAKVRSQATVLKKAVIDEQAKSVELKELIKDLEQKIRKHDQEMDSLTFRNEQLTKRISVLQQDLQLNHHNKKSANKSSQSFDFGVLDEELHKKILENAELVSSMVDKDLEISNYREKIEMLELKICDLQKEICFNEEKHKENLENFKKKFTNDVKPPVEENSVADKVDVCNMWQQEAERWRSECEMLRAKPESNERLSEYYESQISELLEAKQAAQSETSSLWAENAALCARLEHLTLEKDRLESSILQSIEELHVTSDNYKSQLDAMTEHLASQNEKIARQCDEIQVLKHKLSTKK
ncbi:hypothetical protein PPYR_01999 [Photinus pyralis]|uniref:Protein phosphatase 1 regulatory subunit 21 N-terminal domain-containing protein n=1 Tax=Photinus pyralis TaxID=7054 RepID=A0A1Y1N8N5_PHOPY|nr:protein phosphatase 1 regulatory subunit 21 [Photinus pyralis]KAB0805029.1 hypothetical protein PPYR_01999 [Photinus pyralis]